VNPVFIAVWSYLGLRLDDNEAETIAVDLLEERLNAPACS